MAKTPKVLRRNAVVLKAMASDDVQFYYEDMRPASVWRLSR